VGKLLAKGSSEKEVKSDFFAFVAKNKVHKQEEV
jgi:hypothetical protein